VGQTARSPNHRVLLTGLVVLFILAPVTGRAQVTPPPGDSGATTESSCNFGMGKGQLHGSCRVPIPDGCVVARQPGSTKPWSNISKGGHTTCRFNEKETDWKTRITGTCGKCKSVQCSARFGVMFDCTPGR
jgi:hypothetical protein